MRRERNISKIPGGDQAAIQRWYDALSAKDKKKYASARRIAWRRKLREEASEVSTPRYETR